MKLKNYLHNLLIIALALISPKVSFGDTVMPTLEGLTQGANVIVVAQVEEITVNEPESAGDASSVRETGRGMRIATARVVEVWKGTAGERVQFRASPSWACDDSTAVVGETVILFLNNESNNSVMSIAYNGVGRLPIENSSVLLYSTLLTEEIKRFLGLPEETFRHQVEVATFKQQVQRIAEDDGRNAE